MFKNIEFSYPTPEELSTVINHIDTSSAGRFVEQDSVREIVRAGLGLTEDKFVDLCLQSIIQTNKTE